MSSLAISIDIGAALKDGFTTAFAQAGGAAAKLDKAIATVDTRIGTMDGWRAAKKETASAKEEWERATAKLKALERQMAATAHPTEDLKNKVAAAGKEADQAKTAFMGAATGLRAMDGQMKAAGVSIKTVKIELDAAERSMAALTRRREALNNAMAAKVANDGSRAALKGQIFETVALGAALAAPIHQAIKFETAMSDVKKAVDFDKAGPGLKGMELTIKEMARVMPVAHTDLAAIITAGGKAGVAEKDLRTYTETVARMSTAWEMAPDAVGTAMGKIGNVLKLTVGDLELVGDSINVLADSGNSNEREIVDVMQRISGIGPSAHMSAQQLAALAATFIDVGAAPEVAATGINSMMNALLAAPTGTKKFQEGLEQIGWSAEEMQRSMLKDAQGTLVKFLDTLQEVEEGDRMNLMANMFGAQYSDDMNRLIGGLDTYKDHLKTIGNTANYAGSMQEGFNEKTKTTAAQLQLASNRVNELTTGTGGELLPAVKDVARAIGVTASAVADLSTAFPVVTKAIVYTTAAVIGYKVASLAVKFALTAVKAPFLDARIAYTRLTAAATISTARTSGFGGALRGTRLALAQTSNATNVATGRLRQFTSAANVAATASSRLATAQSGIGKLGGLSNAARMGGKALGGAGLAISAGFAVADLMDKDKTANEKASSVGNLAGGLAGAAAGAAIGSVVPVIGTAIGGLVGGLIGAYGGEALGGQFFKDEPAKADAMPNDNAVNDNAAAAFDVNRAAKAGGGSAPVYHQNFTINVYGAPGQSPDVVAGAVKKAFQGAASGGELYDKE